MANLAKEMDNRLPDELSAFLRRAGQIAASVGQDIYLVGGVVRDLLLGKANTDLDLVMEGDAGEMAARLLPPGEAMVTFHRRFNTATLIWRHWRIDLTSARRESYARPGALPSVSPGLLGDDLLRRDFCINAMAASLNPSNYGAVIDSCGGRDDLKNKLIRVLHPLSFSDDATRIWRAIRYEQRLGFQIEEHTLSLLEQDIPMLATISGDRIRYEIECILSESEPEKALHRAAELGVLRTLHPGLKGNGWLKDGFVAARHFCAPQRPSVEIYLALLTYRMKLAEKETLTAKLNLTKPMAAALKDTSEVKARLKALAGAVRPSVIYNQLRGFSRAAVIANMLTGLPLESRKAIKLYVEKLRFVRRSFGGDELLAMGMTPGPAIKNMLERLLEARLDGEVTSRQEEERLVEKWIKEKK